MSASMTGAGLRIADAANELARRLGSIVVELRSGASAAGTGIIWGESGLVVTNAHCVPDGMAVSVAVGGRRHSSQAIAYDRRHDLALVAAPSGAGVPLAIRDPESLRPGELLFALGHPLGIRDSLAMGSLHAVARDTEHGAARWIVADVRLAPGNSGGPLVDAEGRLVGINSMVVNGLGVAVPASIARRFVDYVVARRAA